MHGRTKNMHDFIYFYKDKNNNKIPILTGSNSNLESIVWLTVAEKKKILTNWKESENNLFVFVDGAEFKLA